MSVCANACYTTQLYYSCRIIKGGGGGCWGKGEVGRWVGEREILVVVTQCLLLPTGTHHSYTTHTVSLKWQRCWGQGGVGG